MSQENVEIVRRGLEAWQQGGPWAEFLDPEIEWDLSACPGLDIPVRGRGARTTFDSGIGTTALGSTTRWHRRS